MDLGEDVKSRPGKANFDETVPGVIDGLKNYADYQKQTSDTSYEGIPSDFDPKSSAVLAKPSIASPEVGIGEDHSHKPADRCHIDNLITEEEGRLERRGIELSHKSKETELGRLLSMNKRQSFDDDGFRSDIFKPQQSPSPTVGGAFLTVVHDGDLLPKHEEGRKAPQPTECYPDYSDGVVQVGASDGNVAKGLGQSKHQHECGHSRTTEHEMASIARVTTENQIEGEADVERYRVRSVHSAHDAVSPDCVKHNKNAEFTREPQSPPLLSRRSSRQLEDSHAEKIHSHEVGVYISITRYCGRLTRNTVESHNPSIYSFVKHLS